MLKTGGNEIDLIIEKQLIDINIRSKINNGIESFFTISAEEKHLVKTVERPFEFQIIDRLHQSKHDMIKRLLNAQILNFKEKVWQICPMPHVF